MDEALFRMATAQHGVFTTAQATELGWCRKALLGAVRDKALVHLGRSLYAVPAQELDLPEGRHRALCRGALLLYPDAVLGHASAVLGHGLPLFDSRLTRAFLLRPVPAEVLTQSFVIRPLRGVERVTTDLGPAADAATAIVQHTLDNGVTAGVVAADAALHTGLVALSALQRAGERVSGWPHSGRIATLVHAVDARSESVGESRTRLELTFGGVPVVPQAVIREADGGFVARVDFLVKGTMVVVEFDGLVKYREGGAEALVAEKQREDRLRRLGYIVVRVTWADLAHPGQVVRRVREATAIASGLPTTAA